MSHDPSLPRITRYLGMSDGGPCDPDFSAECPHCGAGGRYVHHFECEDGTTRGAMSGCVELFEMTPVAKLHKRLTEKARDAARDKRTLNKLEQRVMFALDEFYAGRLPQERLDNIINGMRESNANYARKMGRR